MPVKLNEMLNKIKWKDRISDFLMPVCAVVFALGVGALLIAVMGLNVRDAYASLIKGAFGTPYSRGEIIVKTTPLIFTALSYALAKRCGLFNLGAEGQIYIGGLCGGLVGLYLDLPAVLHVPLAFLAGFIGGGLFAALAAYLKIRFNASEMITTIMLNYIAVHFINYLVGNVIKEPGALPQSAKMLETAQLTRIIPGTRITVGIILALACVGFYYIFLWHTQRGFEVRVVGLNAEAGRYAGFNSKRLSVLAMFISGGIAGFAGVVEILGIQIRIYKNFSPGYGWDGIAASLLGRNSPIGIILASAMFGTLRSGSNQMQIDAKVPSALIYILQALIIIFVIGSNYFIKLRKKRQIKLKAKGDK